MKILDLFCGGGGAGMGYHHAWPGAEIVGVDIHDMSRYYPFTFVQGDALEFPLDGYDFIHASPPCQRWTAMRHAPGTLPHPDLITGARERLEENYRRSGTKFCIENVIGAPLRPGLDGGLIVLCGSMFRLC